MRYEAPQIAERVELTGLLFNLGKSPETNGDWVRPEFPFQFGGFPRP